MVFRNGNALNLQRKSFLRMLKHRTYDTSEIFGLEIKGKFRRFGICSVSPTIGINRREFCELLTSWRFQPKHKKTVTELRTNGLCVNRNAVRVSDLAVRA
jgi:hypothetical protein